MRIPTQLFHQALQVLWIRQMLLVGLGNITEMLISRYAHRFTHISNGKFDNLIAFLFAQDDADTGILMWPFDGFIEGREVEIHLPEISRLEFASLEFKSYEALQCPMEEQKINKEFLLIHNYSMLIPDESKIWPVSYTHLTLPTILLV